VADRAREQAERILATVPSWLWDGERLPIPVEDIVDTCFGLHVREVEDMSVAPGAPTVGDGQQLSGLLLPARGEIWVNADEARQWPPRRRFTIGHELGHWVMHRTGQESLFCRRTTVEDARAVLAGIEEEASQFAAELLMPRWLLVREHAACNGDVDALCARFSSSRAAMERRVAHVIVGARSS
jgi:hypothetical protein